jgi:hypothetical protein
MHYFYKDTEEPGRPKFNLSAMDGTKAYLRHFDNYLFLQFVSTNERASELEKRQARHELTICERKLEYWKRHPRYEHEAALRGVSELKKNWGR